MDNIRNKTIELNWVLAELEEEFQPLLRLKSINVGKVPNDCTGDTCIQGVDKMINNLNLLLVEIRALKKDRPDNFNEFFL